MDIPVTFDEWYRKKFPDFVRGDLAHIQHKATARLAWNAAEQNCESLLHHAIIRYQVEGFNKERRNNATPHTD